MREYGERPRRGRCTGLVVFNLSPIRVREWISFLCATVSAAKGDVKKWERVSPTVRLCEAQSAERRKLNPFK